MASKTSESCTIKRRVGCYLVVDDPDEIKAHSIIALFTLLQPRGGFGAVLSPLWLENVLLDLFSGGG